MFLKKILIPLCSMWFVFGLSACADLQQAVKSGNLAAVESALANGEDINARDDNGNTPLLIAAKHGDFGIVLALHKKGADLRAKNKEGFDALLLIANYSMPGTFVNARGQKMPKRTGITLEGHLKIAAYLLDRGAEVNVKSNEGATPLMLAARLNKKQLVELLLARGAEVNAADKRGQTSLIAAAREGQAEVVCPLLGKGAQADAKDAEGNTALQYAEKLGHNAVLQMLKNPCPVASAPTATAPADESAKLSDKQMQREQAREDLVQALKSPDPSVRWEAARQLGELKDNRAVVPLIGALQDEHPYVRRRAAFSLGSMQDLRAVEPLMKTLGDEDQFVQEYALKALEKIAGQRLGADPKKWQEWWDRQVRRN